MEKVVYKAPNVPGSHMPDVFIMTEPGMAAKYRAQRSHQGPGGPSSNHQRHAREADKSEPAIALVDVVQSFDIYQTATGKGFEGRVARPAKSDLAAIFNTENYEDIAERIIMQGEIQSPHHGK